MASPDSCTWLENTESLRTQGNGVLDASSKEDCFQVMPLFYFYSSYYYDCSLNCEAMPGGDAPTRPAPLRPVHRHRDVRLPVLLHRDQDDGRRLDHRSQHLLLNYELRRICLKWEKYSEPIKSFFAVLCMTNKTV